MHRVAVGHACFAMHDRPNGIGVNPGFRLHQDFRHAGGEPVSRKQGPAQDLGPLQFCRGQELANFVPDLGVYPAAVAGKDGNRQEGMFAVRDPDEREFRQAKETVLRPDLLSTAFGKRDSGDSARVYITVDIF